MYVMCFICASQGIIWQEISVSKEDVVKWDATFYHSVELIVAIPSTTTRITCPIKRVTLEIYRQTVNGQFLNKS